MNKRELVNYLTAIQDPKHEYNIMIDAIFRQVSTDLQMFLEMLHGKPQRFADLLRTEINEVTTNKTEIGVRVTNHDGLPRLGKVMVHTTLAFTGCLTIEVEPVGQNRKPGLFQNDATKEPVVTGPIPQFVPVPDEEPQFSLCTRSSAGDNAIIMDRYFDVIRSFNSFKEEGFRPSIGFTDNGFYIVLS